MALGNMLNKAKKANAMGKKAAGMAGARAGYVVGKMQGAKAGAKAGAKPGAKAAPMGKPPEKVAKKVAKKVAYKAKQQGYTSTTSPKMGSQRALKEKQMRAARTAAARGLGRGRMR